LLRNCRRMRPTRAPLAHPMRRTSPVSETWYSGQPGILRHSAQPSEPPPARGILAADSAGDGARSRMLFITKAHAKWAFGFGQQ
jgi:hypothetical protein